MSAQNGLSPPTHRLNGNICWQMKLQYLGDSKDAFKWDYLDYLAKCKEVSYLDIVPMSTPDDGTGQGSTPPEQFPASDAVKNFCRHIRKPENRRFGELQKLPRYTGGDYEVRLHKPEQNFLNPVGNRKCYFSQLPSDPMSDRLLFFDPDIGFEAPKTSNTKHIKYADFETIWPQVSENSIICVFQHGRQIHYPFEQHYKEIVCGLRRIGSLYSSGVFWGRSLMFVQLVKSDDQHREVCKINKAYSDQRRPLPVRQLD